MKYHKYLIKHIVNQLFIFKKGLISFLLMNKYQPAYQYNYQIEQQFSRTIMNAQLLYLILNDILSSVLAIGMTLNSNQIILFYAIIPFVTISLIIRIIYQKLKKPHSYLNILAVALYVIKIIILCLAEQQSTSILKLQLIMDILIFINQKTQIKDLQIIVGMISVLAIIDYLKFEGNYEKYIWILVCEIIMIFLDIIISLEIGKNAKKNEQKIILKHQSVVENSHDISNNQSILLPIQVQSKLQQSDDMSLITLNKKNQKQINEISYLNQEQYIVFNENFNINYTQIELGQYFINNNIIGECNYLILFLNLPVIYITETQQKTTTIIEYIENNAETMHYYQVFSVQENPNFDFQGLIFSCSKQTNQTETQYMIHFFNAPYVQYSDKQKNEQLLEVCKSLSHELGTNLNSIQTFSDMGMSDDSIPLPIKQKYFKPILINSEQLTYIVRNLRDFQLLNLNQFNIKIEEFDLIEEMDKVDTLFHDAFANKNLAFIRELRSNSTIFYNDKHRFLQVYFQLLQNAVKFTQEGLIKVIIENNQKNCEITIIDTGIGLNEDEQNNLKLLLEDDTSVKVSSNSVGSGLGLRIANSLVNKMNSKNSNIKYQTLLQGSAFSINLRNFYLKYTKSRSNESETNTSSIKKLSAQFYIENSITMKSRKSQMFQSVSIFCEIQTMKQQDHPSSQIDFDSMAYDDKVNLPHLSPKLKDSITQFSIKSRCCSRVLVVDDEFFNIQCIKVIMESQYQAICSTAYNGREAMSLIQEKLRNPCKICQNNSFQIIFLDINMPIMDGFETVKQIKQLQHKKIISKNQCIANTGFCDLETKMKSYDAGMDFYLTKPLDRKLLNEIITTLFPK